MNGMEDQYRNKIQEAEIKYKEIKAISQWKQLETQENSTQFYSNVHNNITTFKLVRELNINDIDLDHYEACFTTIPIRKRWYPGIRDINLVYRQSKDSSVVQITTLDNEINITYFEQVLKNKSCVQYMNLYSIDDQVLFMSLVIESNPDYARATVYHQWEKPTLATYTSHTLSILLNNLINLKPFPYISDYQTPISIQHTLYNENNGLDIDYLYQLKEDTSLLPTPAVDIHQKMNPRWHSGSWDQQDKSLRKNTFMASSFLFSANSSPQLNPSTSYPSHKMVPWAIEEEDHFIQSKDELTIHTPYIPTLIISLPDKNDQFLQSFSQLCVNCYQHLHFYIIQIMHPQKLIQYLNQEPNDTLDEEQDMPLLIKLSINKSLDNTFRLNQNEYSIKTWKQQTEEEEKPLPTTEEIDVFEDDINVLPSSDPIEQPEIEPPVIKNEAIQETSQQILETNIPEHDPVGLAKIYPKFTEYLHPLLFTVVQSPNKDNGFVTIKKFDIPDHPLGGFLGETTWKDCSIWDVKAVLENAGARKIWDPTFESSTFLHTLTSSSSLWHTKMKGAWPVSPRDYVYFYGQYTTGHRVDLLSTSCFGDSYQYKALPKSEIPGYVRATANVMGWRLERLDEKTVSVQQVVVTQFPTWVVNFITSRLITQTCAAVHDAQNFLSTYGAPPSLENLSCAQLVNLKYDHERKNWRCEYTRRMDHTLDSSTSSLVRLDKRQWALQNQYSVVIDPPPSRVSALERVDDPYGVWLTVEHDEAFIIPLRGKILVLIKPDEPSDTSECHLNVNGVSTPIDKEKPRPKQASHSQSFSKPEPPIVPLSEHEKTIKALDELPVSPKDHAQASLAFLKQTDEQFGWTLISDNAKQGLRISKKSGTKKPETSDALKVYEPYMVYKGTKVIENFSLEEIAAVVTDIHHVRQTFDDTIEQQIDLVRDEPGLCIVRQSVKAIFPFKNREFYTVSCLAQEASTSRMFYIESALPDFPIINKTRTRGQLLVSGWVLEPIDPYNTTTANHPIPSTRVTYVASLDLGNSVPSYISNLVANNWFPKKIQAVETYLKTKGPPPYVSSPNPALLFANNQLVDDQAHEWTRIHSLYDASHHFKVTNELTVKSQEPDIAPSPSTGASLVPPFRRPSNHTIRSENRRGSLPTNAVSKKRNINVVTPTTAISTTSTTHRAVTFLQTTFDLRAYLKGYEVQAHLYNVSAHTRKNMTHHLVLSITEPPLSNLMDKKSLKHTLTVKATVPPSQYVFEFSLIPAHDDKRATQLTVSHVLGDDEVKDTWNGIVLVNGIESQVNQDIQFVKDEDGIETTMEEGNGVVATALGNVSAGVNNIGARMMIPFRAASNSFLLSNSETVQQADESEILSLDYQEQCTDERVDASTTLHEIRVLQRRSDTMRKGMLLLFICVGLAIVFALLMLQPLLERYSSFTIPSTLGNGIIKRLIQIPWFGGWDIQVIAVKRPNL